MNTKNAYHLPDLAYISLKVSDKNDCPISTQIKETKLKRKWYNLIFHISFTSFICLQKKKVKKSKQISKLFQPVGVSL